MGLWALEEGEYVTKRGDHENPGNRAPHPLVSSGKGEEGVLLLSQRPYCLEKWAQHSIGHAGAYHRRKAKVNEKNTERHSINGCTTIKPLSLLHPYP